MFGPWKCRCCGCIFRQFDGPQLSCPECGDESIIVEAQINEVQAAWFGGATNQEGEVYGG